MSRIHKGNDTREAEALVKRATQPIRHLSYFERNLALRMGKTLTSDGLHLDLNEAANQMTQPANLKRINPNVKASATYSDNSDAPQESGEGGGMDAILSETEKAEKEHKVNERLISIRSLCARMCQKDGKNVQGRSQCPYCFGEGWLAKTERINAPSRNDHLTYVYRGRKNANQR